MTGELALALGVVFAVNLLPAFGPPTWAVLVFFSIQYDLPAVLLVLGGALAAASGRYLLLDDALTSPLGLALQLAMLVALGVLLGGVRPGESPRRRLWGSPDGRAPRGS